MPVLESTAMAAGRLTTGVWLADAPALPTTGTAYVGGVPEPSERSARGLSERASLEGQELERGRVALFVAAEQIGVDPFFDGHVVGQQLHGHHGEERREQLGQRGEREHRRLREPIHTLADEPDASANRVQDARDRKSV